MTININTIEFEPAEPGFNPNDNENTWLGHTANTEHIGYGEQGELILTYSDDIGKAELAYSDGRNWHSTSTTHDWPIFDKIFTRRGWQNFLNTIELNQGM